jgi:hypothetical protein
MIAAVTFIVLWPAACPAVAPASPHMMVRFVSLLTDRARTQTGRNACCTQLPVTLFAVFIWYGRASAR